MSRRRNAPLKIISTYVQPVRVYRPTASMGYYSVAWYEPGDDRQQRTTVGKVEAEAVAWAERKAETLRALQQAPHPDRPLATVAELLASFLDIGNHGGEWRVRHATKQAYLAKRWLPAELLGTPCRLVTATVLQAVIDAADAQRMSVETLQGVRALLTGLVGYGRRHGYLLDGQRLDGLTVPMTADHELDDRRVDVDALPTVADIDSVLAAVKHPTYRTMVAVAVVSGARFGELAGLTWDRVNVKAGTFDITRKLAEDTDGSQWMEATKNRRRRRRRTFYAPTEREAMVQLVEAARADAEAGGLGLVFPSPNRLYLRRSNFVRRHWKPARDLAGWDGWTFHTLRHVAAVAMLDDLDLAVTDVARMLGHRDPQTTYRIYLEGRGGAAEAAAKRLGWA